MGIQKFIKKGAAGVSAAALVLAGMSTAAYADPYNPGDATSFWMQLVVQNEDGAWMNDAGNALTALPYQAPQHYVMDVDTEVYAQAADAVQQISLIVGCDASFEDKDTDQVNLVISNITLYFDGYDPLVIADYSSEAAGTNMLPANRWIAYDFKDQIPAEGRGALMQHIDRVEFDMSIEYAYFADAPEAVPTETAPEETEEQTEASTEEKTEAPTEKETEAPTEKETEAPTEKETDKPEETEASTESPAEQTSAADASSAASTEASEEEGGGNNVKIVIAIVAAVILLGACIGVGIVFVKKNRLV